MDAWIPITVAAAFFQNLRSALQKHLKGRLSTTGATFSRFAYAAPLALLYVAALAVLAGHDLPAPNSTFVAYAVIGGLAQITATALLLYSFAFRNFAVGTTYSKTETVQTAIFGIVLLGDPLGLGAAAAIVISLIGVMAISVARTRTTFLGLLTSLLEKPALIGIASGAFFGLSAISYRGASLSLGDHGFLIRAAYTLACVTVFQTLVMALYMRLREPGQVTAVFRAWRVAAWAGISGMVASACWFTAMTIQNAAYVRALGQIELVFTFAASILLFREWPNRAEVIGILLVIAGILLVLLHCARGACARYRTAVRHGHGRGPASCRRLARATTIPARCVGGAAAAHSSDASIDAGMSPRSRPSSRRPSRAADPTIDSRATAAILCRRAAAWPPSRTTAHPQDSVMPRSGRRRSGNARAGRSSACRPLSGSCPLAVQTSHWPSAAVCLGQPHEPRRRRRSQ